jgi:hypothetical protein
VRGVCINDGPLWKGQNGRFCCFCDREGTCFSWIICPVEPLLPDRAQKQRFAAKASVIRAIRQQTWKNKTRNLESPGSMLRIAPE